MAKKSKADREAEDKANKEHREQLAREANEARNTAQINARNAIADKADEIKDQGDDLEPLTDEVWDQEDRPEDKRKTRAELEAEQEAEEEAEREREAAAERGEDPAEKRRVVADAEEEDLEADEARDAGADDVRKNEQGVTEYRLVVNGKAKWLSLEQLRATAGKVESADEYLQESKRGAKTTPTQATDPASLEEQRQAAEKAQAEARATHKAKLKDLYSRASMGDEEAIDELAEIQAGLSRVTPDVLRIVDERVDARVQGRTAFESAVTWFEGEYADELRTPTLKAQAARRDRDLANENPDMAPKARLKLVGDELRQLRKDLGGMPTDPRLRTKEQRKERLNPVPRAAGRQRPEPEEDETESTQDAIRAMARSRGQARAIKH